MKLTLKRKPLSFRKMNILIFVLLLLAAVGFTDYVLFSNWLNSAEQNVMSLAASTNSQIFSQIDNFVAAPQRLNAANRSLLENLVVDLDNKTEREKYFVSLLESMAPEIYSISYGSTNGEYYGARRTFNDEIQIMLNDASTGGHSWYYSITPELTADAFVMDAGQFDPRTRDWYTAAVKSGQSVFSSIYKHFVMEDLALSVSTPIYIDGQISGVFGSHIILSRIDTHLQNQVAAHGGLAVIVERGSSKLVANSFGSPNYTKTNGGEVNRLTLKATGNTFLATAFQRYQEEGQHQFHLPGADDEYYFQLTDYKKNGIDWLVITAIPQNLFMAGINNTITIALLLTALVCLIAFIIYYSVTNRYLKPIGSLIEATEKFAQGDFTQRVEIVRQDEIGKIAAAYNHLADTLDDLVNNLEDTVRERTLELEARNENLRQADQSKNEFINALSHELRNPLAAIIAGLSVYELAPSAQKKERAIEIIKRQAEQLNRLVDDLLDVTRIMRNKANLQIERFDLSELVILAVEAQRPLFDAKGINLVADISADISVDGDPVRVSQSISNLLHNASKFCNDGDTTWVSLFREGKEAVIAIRDNGIGITPEDLDSLFEPFTQIDSTLDRQKGGLGLGLSIVKGMIELHGGRVSAASEGLGKGSEFRIYLPL